MRTNGTEQPNKFWHNIIGNKVELFLHENIEETISEDRVSYNSDMQFGISNNNRNDIIAGFIRLKYSIDAEFALINKGIFDNENEEFLEYRNFVNEVKEYVGEQLNV